MTTTFSIPSNISPQIPLRYFANKRITEGLIQNTIRSMDTAYAFSANILFHERRDESLVDTYATDDKSGYYPWYNNSDSGTEEGTNRWDCRIYRMPYFPSNPTPGSDSPVTSSASRIAVRARGRACVVAVIVREIVLINTNGTASFSATSSSLILSCVGTAAFEDLADELTLPTGIDVSDPGFLGFSIEAYWAPLYDDLGGETAWLSQLTLVEFTPSDFPA